MILNSSIDSRLGVDSSVMFEPTSTFDTPSTSQFTALRRAPLIDMLTVLASPTPTSSARSLETPGASVASCTKLRLLSGSSCTCCVPIVVCSAAIGWMSGLAALTMTLSATPPTLKRTSICSRSLTCSAMFRCVALWKPCSSKVIS